MKLETARCSDALDGRHDGNLDRGDGVAGPSEGLEQRTQGCGALAAQAFHFGEIASGAEVSSSASDEDHVDRGSLIPA